MMVDRWIDRDNEEYEIKKWTKNGVLNKKPHQIVT
jgi:hypothetical protein